MTKADAIIAIVRDARAERYSKASYERIKRALKALGFAPTEMFSVLVYLDYHHPDTPGLPYSHFTIIKPRRTK